MEAAIEGGDEANKGIGAVLQQTVGILSSSSIAVGARCPWLVAGIGAVSSQNITLPALGQQILARLEEGLTPEQALKRALAEDRFSDTAR